MGLVETVGSSTEPRADREEGSGATQTIGKNIHSDGGNPSFDQVEGTFGKVHLTISGDQKTALCSQKGKEVGIRWMQWERVSCIREQRASAWRTNGNVAHAQVNVQKAEEKYITWKKTWNNNILTTACCYMTAPENVKLIKMFTGEITKQRYFNVNLKRQRKKDTVWNQRNGIMKISENLNESTLKRQKLEATGENLTL